MIPNSSLHQASSYQAGSADVPPDTPTGPFSSVHNAHERLHPCWWTNSDIERSVNLPEDHRRTLLINGMGYLRYVTEDIGDTFLRCTNIWRVRSPTVTSVVSRQQPSWGPLSGVSMRIGGESWNQRRGPPLQGQGQGQMLRLAALREAKHICHLVRYRPRQGSTLGDDHIAFTNISGLRADVGSQQDFVPDLMNRSELLPGGRAPAHSRWTYEGDIYKGEEFLFTRRWAVELVISNYDPSQPSVFKPERLEFIIHNAENPDLEAESISLCKGLDGDYSPVFRSWYLATDGGERRVLDENDPDPPVVLAGTNHSARSVLTLVMTVLPDRQEYESGRMAPDGL